MTTVFFGSHSQLVADRSTVVGGDSTVQSSKLLYGSLFNAFSVNPRFSLMEIHGKFIFQSQVCFH